MKVRSVRCSSKEKQKKNMSHKEGKEECVSVQEVTVCICPGFQCMEVYNVGIDVGVLVMVLFVNSTINKLSGDSTRNFDGSSSFATTWRIKTRLHYYLTSQ